jgi:hypothetical protein
VALERLTLARAARIFALGLLSSACNGRTVYLVPFSTSSNGSGGAMPALDAGTHPQSSGGATMLHVDSGVRDGAAPTCEKQGNPQQPQPLGVYLMVDQSPAMQNQWDAVSAALSQFIQDSASLGKVSVGLQFYAINPTELPFSSSYQAGECTADSYATPKVLIAPLPANTQTLLTAITAQGPSFLLPLLRALRLAADGSPRDAALRGAILGARRWATENAATRSKAVVVLVTNGEPLPTDGLCPLPASDAGVGASAAVAAAATGFAADPQVSTYVLNVGPPSAELDAIAVAGGTDHAYSATTNSAMVHALQDIRELAVPCDVNVGANAKALTENRLNVELSSLVDGTVVGTRFGRVKSVGGSSDSGDATACNVKRSNEWYTEGVGDEITVHLCPSTCAYVRTFKDVALDVLVGCKTITIE